MKFRKATNRCLTVIVFALAVWHGTLQAITSLYAGDNTAAMPINSQGPADNSITALLTEPNKVCSTKPSSRAESARALLSFLSLGEGSVVADIGAGGGRDTWVFAEIVGETGTVYAEEISENKVKSLESEAEKKGLSQVRAVLGRSDDPCLPPNSIDLAFIYHVYHHFAKPREMLRGIWRGLRPGGHLVVVDRRLGTLRDWVPRHLREKKHYWTAETTVVREAREEGFAFTCYAEQCWHEKDHFALIFQRPKKLESPGCDPDPFQPILINELSRNERVKIHTGATIGKAAGFVGNFEAEIVTPDGKENILIGSIVVATNAKMTADSEEEDFEKDLLLQRDENNFFVGTLGILNPLDFNTEGVFRCGTAREDIGAFDAIIDGEAAASRAAGIISQKELVKSPAISFVVDEYCDGCAYCIDPCPSNAITLIEYMTDDGSIKKTVEVNEAVCRGCGVCMATCPKKGIFVRHFKPDYFEEMIKAVVEV